MQHFFVLLQTITISPCFVSPTISFMAVFPLGMIGAVNLIDVEVFAVPTVTP